ncbi:hypothetical protein PVAG01_02794 [Phlyctema vagabunda]|uniref:Uncharacterized protein n=1 Tax=Phlyctema vagabunda TaxID=108571 RepID=A0ABR4PRK3_9HELO
MSAAQSLSLPPTPGRGRSRFSKALPIPPPAVPEGKPKSPVASSLSKSLHSPLPSLPQPPPQITMSIPRKAVGANAVQTEANAAPLEPTSTRDSLSSIYSNYPGFRDSDENESLKDDGNETDAGTPPTLPPKDISDSANIVGSQQAGFETSPPRPEIWRRRSVKSERSITFPEIKIEKSNGATNTSTLPPERELPQLPPPQLPRSVTNRKPIPLRAAPPQPQAPDPMGSKLSKLKNKRSKGDKDAFISDGDSQVQPRTTQPTQTRLPTPEYRQTDRQQPLTPQLRSPHSPETPPQDATAPPEVPRKSESRNGFKQSQAHTLHDITSPLALPSPVAPPSNIKFPAMPGGPLSPNTVIVDGPPLEIQHFECYQAHKFLRNSRNSLCPVACMVCKKRDAEARWRCTWCCLRSCATCMQVLHEVPNKDLRLCLEQVEKTAITA